MNININLTEVPLNEALKKVEAAVLEHAMKSLRFNQSAAAKELGMSRGTLRSKLKEHFPGVYIK